jgi:hypothetical protein
VNNLTSFSVNCFDISTLVVGDFFVLLLRSTDIVLAKRVVKRDLIGAEVQNGAFVLPVRDRFLARPLCP